MKCKQCGANYRTRELKCPYCNTPNLIGRLWQVEKDEVEQEYEKTKKDTVKAIPHMINRICKRVLLIQVLIFILIFLGAFFFFFMSEKMVSLDYKMHTVSIDASVEEAYQTRDFQKLDQLLDKYQTLAGDKYDTYRQADVMHNKFQSFLEHRTNFLELTDEKKMEDRFYLEYSIDYGRDVLTKQFGLYSKLSELNRGLYEEYSLQIRAYFVGMLGFTKEELELCSKEDDMTREEEEKFISDIRERRAWK